jgi:hypothetical protein
MRASNALVPTKQLSSENREVYQHFKRYFGLTPSHRGYGSLFGGMRGMNKGRDDVSEILPKRLFLTNIVGITKHIGALTTANLARRPG